MPTVQKSIRMQKTTIKGLEQIARESGKRFSVVANELLDEAIRMQRCPGIVFSEGTKGKRARIAGTGLEVWEIIATYRGVGEAFDRLRKTYHWLTEQQLISAVGYYRAYPEEIDALILQNESLTGEFLRKTYPFLVRGSR